MKKVVIVLLLMIVSSCASPPRYPEHFAREIYKNKLRVHRFVELMDNKKTTRKQEQRMIKANLKAWNALVEIMKKGEIISDAKLEE